MGISEYIAKKKQIRTVRREEKIRLLKPVINVLIGDYSAEEFGRLFRVIGTRIGQTGRVRFLKLKGNADGNLPEEVYSLDVPDIRIRMPSSQGDDTPCSSNDDTLAAREDIKRAADSSEHLRGALKDYVNDIFNEVSTVPYAQKGRLRLNFIVRAESAEAAALPRYAAVMKEEFRVYFPNGVDSDVYLLIDQMGYKTSEKGDERKAFSYLTMNEVREMKRSGLIQMPFLLSNYLSTDCLDKEAVFDIMTTVGLMTIVKDGQSAEAEGSADRYRDESFQEDCGAYGDFYSLGHFKLKTEEDSIGYIVYRTVLNRLRKSVPNIDIRTKLSRMELLEDQVVSLADSILPLKGIARQMLYPMVKNSRLNVAEFMNADRRKLISDLYGGNLDIFFRVNCEDRYQQILDQEAAVNTKRIRIVLKEIFEKEHYSVSDMNALFAGIRLHLTELRRKAEESLDAGRQEIELWMDQKSDITNLKDKNKHTKEPEAFYVLGKQYLDKKLEALHSLVIRTLADRYLQEIERTAGRYGLLAGRLSEASAELTGVVGLMTEQGPELCVGNLNEHYTALTEAILDEDDRFERFESKLNGDIYAEELGEEEIYNRIIEYCDGAILADSRFEKDFSAEMLKRLLGYDRFSNEEKIYDFALETIMDHETYFANVTSVRQMNSEVCFLVNPRNRFVIGTKDRMQQIKASRQIKVFYEEYFSDMDVLFLEGCFELESFYNYGVYQAVYNRLAAEQAATEKQTAGKQAAGEDPAGEGGT